MKKPIKINTDRTPLSSDEINHHQNFKNMWKDQYLKPKPFYKKPKFFGAVILILTTAIVVIIDNFEKGNHTKKIDKLSVMPPIKNLDIKHDTFYVEAEKGDTIIYESGTQIIIPGNCFMNEEGDTLKGKVEIQYREFNSTLDLFLCGIPMAYDSGGVRNQFESAGMMEIKGFQNNNRVFIRKTKSIHVNLASTDNNAGINLYRFDSVVNNWVNIGKDSVNEAIAENAEKDIINDKTTASEIQTTKLAALGYIKRKQERRKQFKLLPVAPVKLTSNFENFKIGFDPTDFPEIAIFENVKFQLTDSTIKIKPNEVEAIWEAVTLKQMGNKYIVSFYGMDKVVNYKVIPAFEGKDLPAAQVIFNKKMEIYKLAIVEKKKAEAIAQKELLEAIKLSNANIKKENEANKVKEAENKRLELEAIKLWNEDIKKLKEANKIKEAEIKKLEMEARLNENINGARNEAIYKEKLKAQHLAFSKKAALTAAITRSFDIRNFGIYNCDRIISMDKTKTYNFKIVLPSSIKYINGSVYIIYGNLKSVVNGYYYQGQQSFQASIPKPLNCKMIMVIDDRTIAVCNGEKINNAIQNNDAKLVFELQTINIKNDELQELFNF